MGINLTDTTGNPAITLTPGTQESPGNYDNWVYTIDVDQFTDPSQVITITGDWSLSNDPANDGSANTNGGEYVTAPIPNPNGSSMYFGTLNVDFQNGTMTWSFTYADLMANAGQNFDVYFVGKYDQQASDSDLLRIEITCFLTGTMIGAPAGEVAVERLRIGDLVSTADGRAVPVRWIGQKTVHRSVFLSETLAPVLVSAGALGQGLPRRDLYLSANHGLVLDGILVNAGALVNGGSIRFVPLSDMPERFTYYHIETERHDQILANGAAAETFVDYVGRQGFDNYDEYLALYGCDRIIPEMARTRISSPRHVPLAIVEKTVGLSSGDRLEADLDALMLTLKAG